MFNEDFKQGLNMLLVGVVLVFVCFGLFFVGEWFYNLPKNTIRDWTNTALRHGYCWVRMCDEFHRCPVWDERQERCIFLPVDKAKAKDEPTKYKEIDWTNF